MNQLPVQRDTRKAVGDWLKSPEIKDQIMLALPRHLTPDRFLRVALTALNKNPALLQCTRESLWACLLDCSALGLEPDGRRAHLIPYKDKATLIVDYKGLVELVYRSGVVTYVDAFVVHANDSISVRYGLKPDIDHLPNFNDPGGFVAAYAVAHIKGTDRAKFVYMTKAEIDLIRSRSRASNSGPWVTDYEEMAKKTPLRRLCKTLPMSPEVMDLIDRETDLEFPKPAQAEIVLSSEAEPAKDNGKEFLTQAIIKSVDQPATKSDPKPDPKAGVELREAFRKRLVEHGITGDEFMAWCKKHGKGSESANNLDELLLSIHGKTLNGMDLDSIDREIHEAEYAPVSQTSSNPFGELKPETEAFLAAIKEAGTTEGQLLQWLSLSGNGEFTDVREIPVGKIAELTKSVKWLKSQLALISK